MALKPLVWIGRCRDDLKSFPEDVRMVMGFALYLAQAGQKHPDAKPLREAAARVGRADPCEDGSRERRRT